MSTASGMGPAPAVAADGPRRVSDVDTLARLIKRATNGRSWCSTRPATIAAYLIAHGITVPDQSEGNG